MASRNSAVSADGLAQHIEFACSNFVEDALSMEHLLRSAEQHIAELEREEAAAGMLLCSPLSRKAS